MPIREMLTFFLGAFVALFVIVNPFSTASVFRSITTGDSKVKKRYMAKRAAVTAASVLIIFAIIGSYILSFFSITIEAFKIAGGIIIAGVGWKMLQAKREVFATKQEKEEAKDKDDISVIPLAIPMLSGPGAITTVIVLMGETENFTFKFSILLAIIFVCLISYFVLRNASIIDKYLGETGKRVADRIMGLIVMVVGIQFIINGLDILIRTWFIN